jgi:hypothetical protein
MSRQYKVSVRPEAKKALREYVEEHPLSPTMKSVVSKAVKLHLEDVSRR